MSGMVTVRTQKLGTLYNLLIGMHELMIPRCIMRPSIAQSSKQLDPRCIPQTYHHPQSTTPGLHPIFPSRRGKEAELAGAHSRLATVLNHAVVSDYWNLEDSIRLSQ